MKVLAKPKQVRFAMLAKAAGRPHAATLWTTSPEKDPEFKKAIDQNRIVSVRTNNVGSKKDRGVVGFLKGPASYLIFPKALPMAEGTAVIGLKFEELADVPIKDPVKIIPKSPTKKIEHVKLAKEPAPKPKSEPASKSKKEKAQHPKSHRFSVTIQFTATVTRDFEIEAANASAAIESALKEARAAGPGKFDWEMEATEAKKA
jgi:hypothetical protein